MADPTPAAPASEPDPRRTRSLSLAVLRWAALFVLVAAGVAGLTLLLGRTVDTSSPVAAPSPAGGAPGEGAATAAPGGAASALPPADFRLARLDGEGLLGPPDYRGEVVLLDFWATWCGPCHLQAEILDKLHREIDGSNVRFLAVDVGEDAETVRRFVERKPFPYPVVLDPEQTTTSTYPIYGFPSVMIVDREGNVSFLKTGVIDARTLREALVAAGADLA